MSPDQFLHLAIRLAKGSQEAEKRSAVSRAYYAAFHAGRILVEACGIKVPESAEAHDKVDKCLQNCGDTSLETAGRELNALRGARNHADYRLSDQRFASGKHVEILVGVAERVHEACREAQCDTSTVRGSMRAYARNVLRIAIVGED